MDGGTDGRGATLNVVHREGSIMIQLSDGAHIRIAI